MLPARTKSVEEIGAMIGADSLGYVSLEGLKASTKGALCGHCSACFDGIFPAGVPSTSGEDSPHKI